ncbi:MAG TPA: sigma-70 family RNA polymerase sigma factor [Candidatus Deferrimicrobiaceae bacterium]|nr:sigma-70 family RNA polymerase sigma factor [Candidatus Deferrimicrobiaceae bacterium]
MTERNLIQKAQKGDQEAFAELFQAERPKLRAFALGILKNDADAEDAVSDTSEKALDKIGTFDPAKGASLSTWLHTIVKRTCLDMIRKNRDWMTETDHDDEGTDHDDEGEEIPRYRKKEGGPPIGERDPHLQIHFARKDEQKRAEAVKQARAKYLKEAKQQIEDDPHEQVRKHGPRIVDDPRSVQLLDTLTKAGGRISPGTFAAIVRQCALCVEPWKEPFTRDEARGAVKVLEYMARDFADAPEGSGFEAMTENIETLLRMVRPVAERKGTKTILHRYKLIFHFDLLFRGIYGGKPVDKAILLALEITYGRKTTMRALAREKERARDIFG